MEDTIYADIMRTVAETLLRQYEGTDSWPTVTTQDEDEDLDTENVVPLHFSVIVGGDWQPAHVFTFDAQTGELLNVAPTSTENTDGHTH